MHWGDILQVSKTVRDAHSYYGALIEVRGSRVMHVACSLLMTSSDLEGLNGDGSKFSGRSPYLRFYLK